MIDAIKKYFLKSKIRRHAVSVEGCNKEIAKLHGNIAWHEEQRRKAMRDLAEIEIPAVPRSAFK